jgi:hypothetical protein
MALIQADITISPHLLCSGSPAISGDRVVIVVDPAQFEDAEDIVGEIVATEQVTTPVRGCETELTCGIAYAIEFDDSLLPDGLSELLNCHVLSIRCADCCSLWKRLEHIKVVLQPSAITETAYYTQVRIAEDYDIYGFAAFVDNWPSIYGETAPHLDVELKLQVSVVGGNSASIDVTDAEITLLRATPETFKKNMFASPVRIDAGSQIYVTVTESGGTVPPEGLGIVLYYRLASDS